MLLVSELRAFRGTGGGMVVGLPLEPAHTDARPFRLWPPANARTILVATHTDGLAFLHCAFGSLPCHSPWAAFEIDPVALRATPLLSHDGSVIGGVASATEFDGRLYFGAVFDDRIGVWRP